MNLGGFSKGMGNGMSGGFIYQFDPNKACGGLVSHDSIDFSYLGNESSVNETHSIAIETMLHWHIQATGSPKAYEIISNWEGKRNILLCLYQKHYQKCQDSNHIE